MRGRLVAMLVLASCLALSAESGGAIPLEGPQLAYVDFKTRLPRKLDSLADFGRLKIRMSLVTTGPQGELEQTLLKTTFFKGRYLVESRPDWSPDGSFLALILETRAEEERDIYVINRDGTGLRRLTSLGDVGNPLVAPDGRTIYFGRDDGSRKSQVWSVGIDGGKPRPVGKSLRGQYVPTSISPSGDIALSKTNCTLSDSFAVVERCRSSIHLLSTSTGALVRLAKSARAAAFAPDGRRIAYVSQKNTVLHFVKEDRDVFGDLFVLDLLTGQRSRLTRTKRANEETPSWDPSGQQIVFVRNRDRTSRLVEINVDGTCETTVPRRPLRPRELAGYYGPTWQPGPGRGAGRIAC